MFFRRIMMGSKVFNAHQGKFRSRWLNVVPCKNLGLKLDDQQHRISISLMSCYSQFSHKADVGISRLPSVLEPRGLYRIDSKRPNGVTVLPWEMGKQLVCDVTVVDALAPSRLNQGSLCKPGNTATEAGPQRVKLRGIAN